MKRCLRTNYAVVSQSLCRMLLQDFIGYLSRPIGWDDLESSRNQSGDRVTTLRMQQDSRECGRLWSQGRDRCPTALHCKSTAATIRSSQAYHFKCTVNVQQHPTLSRMSRWFCYGYIDTTYNTVSSSIIFGSNLEQGFDIIPCGIDRSCRHGWPGCI